MSNFRAKKIENTSGGAPSFTQGLNVGGVSIDSLITMTEFYDQASEPSSPANGAVWWDGTNMYQYMNSAWRIVSVTAPPAWFGDRGVFGGIDATIDYITISSPSNATDFGDLTAQPRYGLAACSNGSRGVFAGGSPSAGGTYAGYSDIIDYVTIATTGNATDFGDLSPLAFYLAGCSNRTYGLFGGGTDAMFGFTDISYITIDTTGNSVDFGDLSTERSAPGACADKTYGLFGGGSFDYFASNWYRSSIDYVTIATPSNATDFGDLTVARGFLAACSNRTYGLFGGGIDEASANVNTIDYVTIATPGNATDFGDLTAVTYALASCANEIYGVWGGGSGPSNVIQYVTIATPGNATDFGDLTAARDSLAACSGD